MPQVKKQCPIVLVKWLDAWHYGSGKNYAAGVELDPVPMYDVGYMLSRTKKGISLAGCFDEDGDCYNQIGFIPAGMIKSIKVLKK